MTPSYLETGTYRLTPISPVHIQGSDGSANYGQCFIRSPHDNKFIYLVDTMKLQNYLFEHHGGLDIIIKFANWLEDAPKDKGISEFLRDNKFDFTKTRDVARGKVYAKVKKGYNRLYFIRNGMDRAYIPGSSVKGVIRTAVLWKILREIRSNNPTQFDAEMTAYINGKIKEFDRQPRHQKNRFKWRVAAAIVEDILQGFHLTAKNISPKQKIKSSSHFTDVFRTVKIKDSSFIDTRRISEKKARILSLDRNHAPYFKMKHRGNSFIEFNTETYFCPDPGGSVSFDISLDTDLLKKFSNSQRTRSRWGDYTIPFQNLDQLMAIVFEFSEAVWEELGAFHSQFYQKRSEFSPDGRQQGVVQRFFYDRGFGFIQCPRLQKDLFFHINEVQIKDRDTIREKDKVSFNTKKTNKGLNATDVKVDNTIEIGGKGNAVNINPLIEFYKKPVENAIKIGWGSGLLGTSFALLFRESPNLKEKLVELRDKIISYDGGKPRKHGDEVPKSAKIICNDKGEGEYPLGWVRLERL
ncbi:type III-A CRISPR-associated RAMP protein Csm5 [Desulfonema magnum]|uniref:CRISPR system Cms protein Csm5 n=1 Tax=Desulfonema magnum TaxID=45655 RepID=A0A975BUF6_9BACT|nr:type III-A CRISPR-associated RAMP protein Csm5 [Desulfonema magnum]QTA91971.1 CRISPR type III-A/MTUBE-associated RAMP protein [Desulfonema magnum]